jgi:hypothetical protein
LNQIQWQQWNNKTCPPEQVTIIQTTKTEQQSEHKSLNANHHWSNGCFSNPASLIHPLMKPTLSASASVKEMRPFSSGTFIPAHPIHLVSKFCFTPATTTQLVPLSGTSCLLYNNIPWCPAVFYTAKHSAASIFFWHKCYKHHECVCKGAKWEKQEIQQLNSS